MANLIEIIKAKIEAAKATLKANANERYTENLKKEIEAHIKEMDQLLAEVEEAGDKADTDFKQAVADSVAKLEKMLEK
jgi:hypothetical protein